MMGEATKTHATGESHGLGHVVPLRTLVGVLGILLVLTWVTVAVTWIDLGPLNLIIALLIATVKASFVLLYFMHLRWDRPFNAVVFISSLAFVMLFIVLALLDTHEYQPDLIPGHAPLMDR
jgi:cytochrome c oxidase subunit 4